jgi:hypothetical protein
MKKVLLFVAVVAFATSCKKNYTCTCTTSVTGLASTTASSTAKMKKKDAETWCSTGNSSSSIGGTTYATSCVLS